MTSLVSPAARALVARAMAEEDRVLVTGASGWFGRTALDLLAPLGLPTLALASAARTIEVAGSTVELTTWDDAAIAAFAPTVVLDCAFLTRDRTTDIPLDDYVRANRAMTDRLLTAARLPETRLTLTISSGAAVHPDDASLHPLEANPYGYLKREAELRLADAVAEGDGVAVVARAWSVSGAHVQKPENYALGSMILAAAAGGIAVAARRPVFRRYALADELLAIGIAEGGRGSTTVDSGGELVEMSDLAARVAAVVAPRIPITRGEIDPADPDRYHSDGVDWSDRCQAWGLAAASLDDQIALTARGVLRRG